jgi:hypothetical protein
MCKHPTGVGGAGEYERIVNVVLAAAALSVGFLLGQNTNNFDRWWSPVQPGVREPLHAHRYPSVLYYISAAHLTEYSPGISAADRRRKQDGGVGFLPIGPPHQMENMESSKPLRAIRVELKNGL